MSDMVVQVAVLLSVLFVVNSSAGRQTCYRVELQQHETLGSRAARIWIKTPVFNRSRILIQQIQLLLININIVSSYCVLLQLLDSRFFLNFRSGGTQPVLTALRVLRLWFQSCQQIKRLLTAHHARNVLRYHL